MAAYGGNALFADVVRFLKQIKCMELSSSAYWLVYALMAITFFLPSYTE